MACPSSPKREGDGYLQEQENKFHSTAFELQLRINRGSRRRCHMALRPIALQRSCFDSRIPRSSIKRWKCSDSPRAGLFSHSSTLCYFQRSSLWHTSLQMAHFPSNALQLNAASSPSYPLRTFSGIAQSRCHVWMVTLSR